jgi:hypothetical protein
MGKLGQLDLGFPEVGKQYKKIWQMELFLVVLLK